MANIKKFNPETQSWETWASSSATGVYSVNPALLSEEENVINVEDALIRDREDIDLMKKNISWLALHGGGGSSGGGGGGTADIDNSIIFVDSEGNEVSEYLWRPGSSKIGYQIESSKASNRFSVTVYLDNNTIYSSQNVKPGRNEVVIGNINRFSQNLTHSISIIATDMYDNRISNSTKIRQISISLSPTTSIYRLNLADVEGSEFSINYQASIPGNYYLYWDNKSSIYNNPTSAYGAKQISIINSNASTLSIPYWCGIADSQILSQRQVKEGQTLTFYFVLVSEDGTVKSDLLEVRVTVVSPNELAIQPISLSTDYNNPTIVSKTSIMSSGFVVYLEADSVTYTYTITAHRIEWIEDETLEEGGKWEVVATKNVPIESGRGKYGDIKQVSYPALPGDDFFIGDCMYRIDIDAQDSLNSSKTAHAESFVSLQSASTQTIPLNLEYDTIFDFKIWGTNTFDRDNWQWHSENPNFKNQYPLSTTIDLYNMGGKSDVQYAYCRLTNKAYGVINKTKRVRNGQQEEVSWFPIDESQTSSGLIQSGNPQFTLSLSFFNDYTPDDNRTIFSFGNYHPATYDSPVEYGNGILINNHDYYIKIGEQILTGKLQDDIYHQIDIVFGRGLAGSSGVTSIELYHNGVLLNVNKNISVQDIYEFNDFDEMRIACYKDIQGNLSQYTNVNLQSVSLYSTALNPYKVVCSYINNLVTYQLDGYSLNTTLLNKKLNQNLISKSTNSQGDVVYTCGLWDEDFDSVGFSDYNWIQVAQGGGITVNESLKNVCPIPIVILDFNENQEWTWSRFRNPWTTSTQKQNPAIGVPIHFYPVGGEDVLNGCTVTVKGQGTTSLEYEIKNLDIDFGESRLFWAKNNWFPEQVYTLKADIVDSAHANNASIGRFVNDCAKDESVLKKTPPMVYFEENKANTELFNLPQKAIDPEEGITIKHTLEGFPVLLLARFHPETNQEYNSIKSLGIYSFNLGRDAWYNLGFKLLNKFRSVDGNIAPENATAPYLLGAPNEREDIIDFHAQSWEGIDSLNCTPITSANEQQTIDEINAASNGQYNSSVNAKAPVRLDGFFWSNREGHIRHFWDCKYPPVCDINEGFKNLFDYIVQLPYEKGDCRFQDGTVYVYDWDGSKMIVPDQSQGNAVGISRLNVDDLKFNIPNARFYYVVCMLCGLVDSLGKNLNMRSWKLDGNTEDKYREWYTSFYDMDTAFGLTNAGNEMVDPDACDVILTNADDGGGLQMKFANTGNDRKIYTVRDNKLWGIIDEWTFKDQYGSSGGVGGGANANDSYLALLWSYIRGSFIPDAETFINKYFGMQTEDIGELLYNQDFTVKYVNSIQERFMYGDRKAFVADWIRKRIKFLDSYFGYMQEGGTSAYLSSSRITDSSYNNTCNILHNSGTEYLPMITNSPCILRSGIGGITTNYYYMPTNTPVNVRVASSKDTTTIQTTINNSDILLNIENLASLQVQAITTSTISLIDTGYSGEHELYGAQFGTFSGFTDFDISGNRSFVNKGIDFIKLFKTWNRGDATRPYALTSLNLSGTKSSTVTDFPLNLTSDAVGKNGATYYQNPFENLTDINIVDSCVTGVTLPRDVALFSLSLANSAVQQVNLTGQSILKTVDFSGCVALSELTLDQCSAFETLSLSNLPHLNKVTITNCANLNSLSINMADAVSPLILKVSTCPKLKTVTVTNANSNSRITLDIENLETLNLSGCKFTHFILSESSKQTLKNIDFRNSSVKAINWGLPAIDTSVIELDLTNCPKLANGSVYFNGNSGIEYVRFDNDQNNPIPLQQNAFRSCGSLKRVYGHIRLDGAAVFLESGNFTINGGVFNGYSVGTKRMGDSDTSSTFADIFQTNQNATNLYFGNTAAGRYAFSRTSCDAFDVYYALWHGEILTDLFEMFRECSKIKMSMTSGTDNSPHWTMFEKCINVTSTNSLFRGVNIGPFRLYGSNNNHTGLLSPLTKCTNFNGMFGSSSFICDINAFIPKTGEFYANGNAINIGGFSPTAIYEDVNVLTVSEAYTAYNNPSNLGNATIKESYGRTFKQVDENTQIGFFRGINRLSESQSSLFNNINYLDYDYFDSIPDGVRTMNGCFNSKSGTGIMNLQTMFRNKASIANIFFSFRVTESSGNVTLYIHNNLLRGFTSLARIGYEPAAGLNTDSTAFPFNGSGLHKVITGNEFPYYLLSDCAGSLVEFAGFFRNATIQNTIEVSLPGSSTHDSLFKGCSKLQKLDYCFYDFKGSYRLHPNGFNDCSSLKSVRYLFGTSSSEISSLDGFIPNNLFNTGMRTEPFSITGTDINSKTFEVPVDPVLNGIKYVTTEDNNGIITITEYSGVTCEGRTITYTPVSIFKRTVSNVPGTTTGYIADLLNQSWNPRTVGPFEKNVPNTSIEDMTGCFCGSNTSGYVHDNISQDDIETNPEYCPFDYILVNGKWYESNKNDKLYTFMWVYDGSGTNMDLTNYYLPDDVPNPASVECDISKFRNSNRIGTTNFCCAPDLLRWCKSNAIVERLFSNSGHLTNAENLNNAGRDFSNGSEYGIKGRIPPYLLKPVSQCTSISYMFNCCDMLSSYKDIDENNNPVPRAIPKSFFNYTPNLVDLSYAFRGNSFLKGDTLNGIATALKQPLNLQGVFRDCVWYGGSNSDRFVINYVFTTNRIANTRGAFGCGAREDVFSTNDGYKHDWPIKFESVFNTSLRDHPQGNDWYVFYGWNNVQHETTPTVSTLDERHNYG